MNVVENYHIQDVFAAWRIHPFILNVSQKRSTSHLSTTPVNLRQDIPGDIMFTIKSGPPPLETGKSNSNDE